MPRLGTKGSNKKTVVGELRRTQVITTYGPGAIVDLPEQGEPYKLITVVSII